jgi:hypothetical protein
LLEGGFTVFIIVTAARRHTSLMKELVRTVTKIPYDYQTKNACGHERPAACHG